MIVYIIQFSDIFRNLIQKTFLYYKAFIEDKLVIILNRFKNVKNHLERFV